jgi:hypothetical protein
MEQLRFSLHLKPRFDDTPDRVYHGVADFNRLFLHGARAPQASRVDWITWFAHHHLSLLTHCPSRGQTIFHTTQAFSGYGVAAAEGFLTGVVGQVGDVEEQGLHWLSEEIGGLRAYQDPNGFVVRPDAPHHVLPSHLVRPDGLKKWTKGRAWEGDKTDVPNDIEWANAAIAMGGLADRSLRDPNHPFFTLCALLALTPLPNGQVFPKRSNQTGWQSLYNGGRTWTSSSAMKGANFTLVWLLAQGIVRSKHLFFQDAFEEGQLWEEAEAATRTHPARLFGGHLVSIAERHQAALEQAKAHILTLDAGDPVYPPDDASAHAKLGWKAFQQNLLTTGQALRLF